MAERKRKLGFGQSARSTKATSFTKTSTASATASKAAADAGDGIRNIRTTSLFRAVNFELFIKPNKVVMAFGLVAITGCVAYIAYMNAMAENRKDQIYVAYNADGTTETKRQKSKWD